MATINSLGRKSIDPTPLLSYPDALWEVEDGRIVELPEMGYLATLVATRLGRILGDFCDQHNLGTVVIEAIFILDAVRDLRRRPDVAFVSHDRWPVERNVDDEGDCDVAPDLAIEVVSPNDRDRDVTAKIEEYFRFGVRRVWVVRPLIEKISVHSSPKHVTIYGLGDELVDEEILPGFRLPITPLFRRSSR